jgi:hypothetical protein
MNTNRITRIINNSLSDMNNKTWNHSKYLREERIIIVIR